MSYFSSMANKKVAIHSLTILSEPVESSAIQYSSSVIYYLCIIEIIVGGGVVVERIY